MGQNIIKLIKPADIITLVNALLGFASIIMTLQGQLESALILILIAVIADGADGAVARYSGFGVLGANLDSLSDVISFGVAPAVAAFFSLGGQGYLAGVFPGLFLVCGILRLARFNVSGKKDGFEGIPITAGGFIVALFLLMRDFVPYFEYAFPALLIILSFLMVSTLSYPKMKTPLFLAPMVIVLFFIIAAFYLGYADYVKKGSLLLFILISAYILSPAWRKLYDRYQ
jgi:archaetidylserine synthase